MSFRPHSKARISEHKGKNNGSNTGMSFPDQMGRPVVYTESGILNTSKQEPVGIKTRGALKMHRAEGKPGWMLGGGGRAGYREL